MIRRFRTEGYKSLRNLEVHLRPLTVLFAQQRACDHDESFSRFVQELRSWLNRLRNQN